MNAEAIARHHEIERQYEIQKHAKKFAIPTNDEQVKSQLRQLGKPITLFAEDQAFRRERLRSEILAYFKD
jgi:U4/U6 small nuclear ribonucleoprotein PRP4